MPTTYLKITNWSKYQHYKNRTPPWVKLHAKMVSSQMWVMLDDASKLLAIACILYAANRGNQIPDKPAYFKRVMHLDQMPEFSELIEVGFLEELAQPVESKQPDASNMQADASNTLASASKVLDQRESKSKNNSNNNNIMSGKPDRVNGKEVHELLDYLNDKAGRSYRPVKSNTDLIRARLKEYDLETLRRVVDHKVAQWRGKDMDQYLRPATLFNSTKCAQYVGELDKKPKGIPFV